jgi:hypothetical protein
LVGAVTQVATPGGTSNTGPGQSAYFNGSSSGVVALASDFSALSSWRMEMRAHGLAATTKPQVLWSAALQYNVYFAIGAEGPAVIFQNAAESQLHYCYANAQSLNDFSIRVQRNGSVSPAVYSLQVWNGTTGQPMPITGDCGSVTAGPVNLTTAMMSLGALPFTAPDYNLTGAMAFLRMYNTPSSGATAPPASAPGSEILRYEFENAASLGDETSGRATPLRLTLVGTVTQVATPGGTSNTGSGQSAYFNGSSSGVVALASDFSALSSWRMETRVHGLAATTKPQVTWTAALQYNVYFAIGAEGPAAIIFQNAAESQLHYCYANAQSLNDFSIRVQRNGSVSPAVYSLQVWNGNARPIADTEI